MDFENQEFIYSEAVFCDTCDKLNEIHWNFSHLKALSYEKFDKFKHIKLTSRNPDVNEISDRIDSYVSENDEKHECCLIKYDFKLVSNKYEDSRLLKSTLLNSKLLPSWKSSLEDVINDYNNKRYTSSRIDEINNITTAEKMDMSYDFCNKHNMHAAE